MRRATVALISRLLEWTDEEAEKYLGFFKEHGAVLHDYMEAAGYTLSLFHYPAEGIYEVNINYKGLDFTDPQVQRQRQSVTGYIPKHKVFNKLQEWFEKCGHLAMGSHDPKKVQHYKRMLSRLGGQIVDVTDEVPGGGHYFFVIGWDRHVMDRMRLEPVSEAVDPRDFISQNPAPWELKELGPGIWEVYTEGSKLIGTIYQQDPAEVPEGANQFWLDNPYCAKPHYWRQGIECFRTKQEALDFLLQRANLNPARPSQAPIS